MLKIESIVRVAIFLILSGVVAYVGDYVGHRAGKMKVTIMGFRPRKTSRVIAVATGVLISIITLSVMAVFSKEVRIVLYGLEKIQKEIYSLETRKTELEKEVYELDKYRKVLEKTVNTIANRVSIYPMVFEAYEPLSCAIIKKGSSEHKIGNILEEMKKKVTQKLYDKNNDLANIVVKKGIDVPSNLKGQLLFLNKNSTVARYYPYLTSPSEETVEYLKSIKENQVVTIYSTSNIFLGDDLYVDFSFLDNKMAFEKGETIVEGSVNGSLPRNQVWESVVLLLNDLRDKAIVKGMVPDPDTGLGVDISQPDIWDLCDKIMANSSHVRVIIVAKEDIWTLGPLKFDIKIEAE